MKMNGTGVASALVFMMLVSMVRLGDKSTFGTTREEEGFVKQLENTVKEANKAGEKKWKRPRR